MKNRSGVTLVELLIVMAIFSVVTMGLVEGYKVLSRSGVREFRKSESSIENNIASTLLERDVMMAGYGLADDYSQTNIGVGNLPRSVSSCGAAGDNCGVNGSDTLTLMATAIAMNSRAAQGWSYVSDIATGYTPTFQSWGDAREDININDVFLMMEPNSKMLVAVYGSTGDWLYTFKGTHPASDIKSVQNNKTYTFGTLEAGTILYGIATSATAAQVTQPAWAVKYYLNTSSVGTANCAPGTLSLLRAESSSSMNPSSGAQPVLNCVLDFQVALGLDTDDDGALDSWDNGGVTAATYAGVDGPKLLNRRLKQIRLYVLVQDGNLDSSYTYNNPDPLYASKKDTIRVGDLSLPGGAVGRDKQLTTAQRAYHWKLLTFAVTPRNIR